MAVAAAIAGGLGAVLEWHDRMPIAATARRAGRPRRLVQLPAARGDPRASDTLASSEHGPRHRPARPRRALPRLPQTSTSPTTGRPALTDPDRDPESFYVSAETWQRSSAVRRALHLVLRTLAGRMLLGPIVFAVRHWRSARSRRERSPGRSGHVVGVAVVLAVVWSSGLPIWAYIVGVAWGGGALSLLRSFAEHRHRRATARGRRSCAAGGSSRCSISTTTCTTPITSSPGSPWFDLPAAHTAVDGDRAAAAGAGLYRGYGEIARRYLVRPVRSAGRRRRRAGGVAGPRQRLDWRGGADRVNTLLGAERDPAAVLSDALADAPPGSLAARPAVSRPGAVRGGGRTPLAAGVGLRRPRRASSANRATSSR